MTITGTGGAGKSRLALEVAAAAAVDRTVHLVGLASISDSELVPAAIARAIGVRESPGQSLLEGIAAELAGTGTLLVLDNLEHLTAAAHDVVALLDRAHDLVVLATSRSPLRLSSEHVLQLAPLPIDDAVTLFLELAAARGVVLRRSHCRRFARSANGSTGFRWLSSSSSHHSPSSPRTSSCGRSTRGSGST